MGKRVVKVFLVFFSFLGLFIINFSLANAQQFEEAVINADGSVTGTSSIQRNGDVYSLTGDIFGSIQVHKSSIVLDGAGYTVTGSGEGRGVDLSNWTGQNPTNVFNVTVKNMQIIRFDHGIDSMNSWGNSFIGNYMANCSTGIWLFGSGEDYIALNTFQNNGEGVHLDYSGKDIRIVENNFNDNGVNVYMFLSQKPIVDKNYWSDYLTKYPDAKEIGRTGFWDIPYQYSEDNTDSQPQTKPITDAPFPSSAPSVPSETSTAPTPTVNETNPVIAAFGTIVVSFAAISLIVKKRRR